MKPEIREMKDLRVVYVRRTGNYNTAAGEAWKAICAYAGPKRLFGRNTKCLGIGHDDPAITPEDKLRYDACITVGPDVKGEGESACRPSRPESTRCSCTRARTISWAKPTPRSMASGCPRAA